MRFYSVFCILSLLCCSVVSRRCNLYDPVEIEFGKTTTLQGCKTFLNFSNVIKSEVECKEPNCIFSSYMASGAACNEPYPKVPEGFLESSLCASSEKEDYICRRSNEVVNEIDTSIDQLCLVVSCFDKRNCSVLVDIEIVSHQAKYARIGDGTRQDKSSKKNGLFANTGRIIIICIIGGLFVVVLTWLCCTKAPRPSKDVFMSQSDGSFFQPSPANKIPPQPSNAPTPVANGDPQQAALETGSVWVLAQNETKPSANSREISI